MVIGDFMIDIYPEPTGGEHSPTEHLVVNILSVIVTWTISHWPIKGG
jgi:hypothetical protein